MPDTKDYSNEEELRRAIRAEIEQRDLQRKREQQRKHARQASFQQAEAKRRIYKEELKKYYKDRPGYKEIIGDDGEPDWIPVSEAMDGELLFDDIADDPIIGKRKQKLKLYLMSIVFIVASVAGYLVLHVGKGEIQVTCNIPEARIILDAIPTRYMTDATLVDIPAGEHLITIEKTGYRIIGEQIVRIDLNEGDSPHVTFIMEPIPKGEESGEGTDIQGSRGTGL